MDVPAQGSSILCETGDFHKAIALIKKNKAPSLTLGAFFCWGSVAACKQFLKPIAHRRKSFFDLAKGCRI